MSTLLGTTSDGRALTYDASLYEFSLDGELAAFADVQTLDVRNWVRWRAPELRDWFRHIVAADLDACNKRARAQRAYGQPSQQWKAASGASSVAAQVAAAQMAAQAVAQQRAQAVANTTLEYRSEDASVASVDEKGVVRIVGPGSAGIYARRVGAGGAGPEMRVVTIAIKESDLAKKQLEEMQGQDEKLLTTKGKRSKKDKGGNEPGLLEEQESVQSTQQVHSVELVEPVEQLHQAEPIAQVESKEDNSIDRLVGHEASDQQLEHDVPAQSAQAADMAAPVGSELPAMPAEATAPIAPVGAIAPELSVVAADPSAPIEPTPPLEQVNPGSERQQPPVVEQPTQQPLVSKSLDLGRATSWEVSSKESAVLPNETESALADDLEAASSMDAPSIQIPVMKITSNVVQSYKSKGGVLAKDKQFQLEAHMGYPPLFHKFEGSPFIEVSPDGSVLVRKGLKSGLYTANVGVAPADGRKISKGEVIAISVKIR